MNNPNPEDRNWGAKSKEYLSKMLFEMSNALGFDFSETDIKNSSYAPKAHFDSEGQDNNLKRLAIEVLSGKKEIPVIVKNDGNSNSPNSN